MGNNNSYFKRSGLFQSIIFYFPLAFAFFIALGYKAAMHADSGKLSFYLGGGVTFLGFLFLIYSKVDQIKRGELFTFGVSAEGHGNKYYAGGYLSMLFGIILLGLSGKLPF